MKEYDVLVEMKHNGKNLKAGDSLTLEDKEAKSLLKLKVISEKTMKLSELDKLTSSPNSDDTAGDKMENEDSSSNENISSESGSGNDLPDSNNVNETTTENLGSDNNGDKKEKAGKK